MAFLEPELFVADPVSMGRHWDLEESLGYTRWLARRHYENFHVVSFLLPKRLHQDFYNVYSFCRWAYDLGDEIGDTAESLRLLGWWGGETARLYDLDEAAHPVMVALRGTIKRHELPREPFDDLIRAFVQDQTTTRYETLPDLYGYCRYSANPVGRLVLYLCGYRDAERQRMSDATCTALQLANFWQDVSVDLDKGRIYLPLEVLRRHGGSEAEVVARRFTSGFRAAMAEMVTEARRLFAEGLPLARTVDRRLSLDLELFNRGGMKILDKVEALGYDVLAQRPAISKAERAGVLVSSLVRWGLRVTTIDESYRHARRIARARARNFYYAFVLLDRQRRDSLCSIYAFMRHCDDLSDEPDATAAALDRWRQEMVEALARRSSANPLWPGFADTVERYGIPHRYLHDMIDGVTSDLTRTRVETFDELYRYCYQVASVAGLCLVHIFGFRDPRALELAEKCGIAFQLTNILRDAGEDFRMGRIYLPREDRERFGVDEESLGAAQVSQPLRALLASYGQRARGYYEEARPLLDLVDPSCRSSLWALIEIYSRLLARIAQRRYEVLGKRIRLSTFEKSLLVMRALLQRRAR